MNQSKILISKQLIKSFCKKHHIRSLAIYGSYAREEYGPNSDIDILVDFEPGHAPGFDFFMLELELSRLLGHKVDLQTVNFLSPRIRQSALSEAITIYEQA